MDKINVAVSCPLDTYSGYGARARDFVKALLDLEKYDVKILSQRWGNTKFGYLKEHGEDDLLSRIVPNLTANPDVWIQITVPNEFQRVGKYNIGVTAGIETTLCDASWVEGVNRMDLVLTSSEHSKEVFKKSVYDYKNRQTQQVERKLKVDKPIEVLLEGVNLDKYKPVKSNFDLSSISEQFCFLFVGHWMQGALGQDRKNVGHLVKTFLEAFKNKPTPPALILKTSTVNASIMDKERLIKKIYEIRKTVKGKLPNIYIIHGDLTDEEINSLYNHSKIKSMISLTREEGFGRPLAEFATTGKPIIASGWSGQTDFLKPDMSLLIGGTLEKVHKSAVVKNTIIPESQWFKPDDIDTGKAYREVFKHYKKQLVKGNKQKHFIKTNFSYQNMVDNLKSLLDNYLPEFPKQISLTLPKLELPKLEKL